MARRILRRILTDEVEDPRVFGRVLEIQNSGGGVRVTLYRGDGTKVEDWTVEKLLLLDPSIVEVETRGVVTVRAVFPRILTGVYDADTDELRISELEPQAIVPG